MSLDRTLLTLIIRVNERFFYEHFDCVFNEYAIIFYRA